MTHGVIRPGGAGAILAGILLLAPARPCQPEPLPPLQLLSLVDLPVGPGQYMSSFHVDTWTVQLVAVCRIPMGWDVGGGTDGTVGGTLHGDAGVGAAFLPGPDPHAFKDAFLVRVGQLRPRTIKDRDGAEYPATFSGKASIGRYGPAIDHDIRLDAGNFALRPATSCPPASDEGP